MAQCSTCGSNVPDQATVCADCGMELKGNASTAPASVAPPPIASRPVAPAAPVPGVPAMPTTTPPACETAHGRITLRRGGILTNEVFQLGEHVVIGRFDVESGPVDVDLSALPESSYLSRRHAELWKTGSGQWLIKDLGSQNGTFVRSAPGPQFARVTQDHPVGDGDEIAFGNARFEFRAG